MLVTNHVLAGALIGALVKRPVPAYLLGVASHFALDVVHHWGGVGREQFMRVAVRDGLTGLAVLGAIAALAPEEGRVAMLAGAAGGATPDLDKPYKELTGERLWPLPIARFHSGIQTESPEKMTQELVLMAAGAAALWAQRKSR